MSWFGRKDRRVRELEMEVARHQDLSFRLKIAERRAQDSEARSDMFISANERLRANNALLREKLKKAEARRAALAGKYGKLRRGLVELGKV